MRSCGAPPEKSIAPELDTGGVGAFEEGKTNRGKDDGRKLICRRRQCFRPAIPRLAERREPDGVAPGSGAIDHDVARVSRYPSRHKRQSTRTGTGGFQPQNYPESQFEHASELHVSPPRRFFLKNQFGRSRPTPSLNVQESVTKVSVACMFGNYTITGMNLCERDKPFTLSDCL